jgi:hypothetical protein
MRNNGKVIGKQWIEISTTISEVMMEGFRWRRKFKI